ncbi:MAG: MFS transporter [SAR202 cluster bacterium]|nr:MFS transporter [Dehalococcoidia bacterium]MQG25980.1 MFS transporter [SAR202 cluster bacterium]MQG52661.1 MFS transporter [SAR202 cluster bacterium]|tara:strand:+ start:7614 stop:8855 length:1242 start_codon:yes stop_codon:yes gene_type:complete
MNIRAFESLKFPNFRLLWFGNLCVNSADWLQILTIGWLILEITNGDTVITGAVLALRTLPVFLIGPWAGVLADKFDRRSLIKLTQFMMAVLAVLFAVLVSMSDFTDTGVSGPLKPWHLFVYVGITGISVSIIRPVRQSLVANVVPLENLRNATALNALTRTSARLVAPAIGGMLIYLLGFKWNFYIEAACYLGITISMLRMKTPYGNNPVPKNTSVLKDLYTGIEYISKNRALAQVITLSFVPTCIFQPLVFILPIYVASVLNEGPAVGGTLLAIMGLGGVATSFYLASKDFPLKKGLTVILALIMGCAAISALSLSNIIIVAYVMFLILGVCQTNIRVGTNTLIQEIVPDELRGRVTSIYNFDNGFTAISILMLGILFNYLEVGQALLYVAVFSGFIGILYLCFAKSLRTKR